MPRKNLARMAAALYACEELHKEGELNDNLLPKSSSSDEKTESEEEEAESGGKRKRKQERKKDGDAMGER